jgi:hypothetical protein
MLVSPKLAGALTTLVAGAAMFLTGCSSSSPRDMNYGTDVGAGYIPWDGSTTSDEDSADSTKESADSIDSSGDIDGGVAVDSAIDADN